jgi:hypothetical protein
MTFREGQKGKKTYNTRDSPVVTHPSTNLAVTGLSMGERTGSRVFQYLWSYVEELAVGANYIVFSKLGVVVVVKGCGASPCSKGSSSPAGASRAVRVCLSAVKSR